MSICKNITFYHSYCGNSKEDWENFKRNRMFKLNYDLYEKREYLKPNNKGDPVTSGNGLSFLDIDLKDMDGDNIKSVVFKNCKVLLRKGSGKGHEAVNNENLLGEDWLWLHENDDYKNQQGQTVWTFDRMNRLSWYNTKRVAATVFLDRSNITNNKDWEVIFYSTKLPVDITCDIQNKKIESSDGKFVVDINLDDSNIFPIDGDSPDRYNDNISMISYPCCNCKIHVYEDANLGGREEQLQFYNPKKNTYNDEKFQRINNFGFKVSSLRIQEVNQYLCNSSENLKKDKNYNICYHYLNENFDKLDFNVLYGDDNSYCRRNSTKGNTGFEHIFKDNSLCVDYFNSNRNKTQVVNEYTKLRNEL